MGPTEMGGQLPQPMIQGGMPMGDPRGPMMNMPTGMQVLPTGMVPRQSMPGQMPGRMPGMQQPGMQQPGMQQRGMMPSGMGMMMGKPAINRGPVMSGQMNQMGGMGGMQPPQGMGQPGGEDYFIEIQQISHGWNFAVTVSNCLHLPSFYGLNDFLNDLNEYRLFF